MLIINNVSKILGNTTDSIYGENYIYDPGEYWHTNDPLFLFRYGYGQCGDFANYMTVIMNSIGIGANSRGIISGITFQDSTHIYRWINTSENNKLYLLWTWSSMGNYNFLYHIVTHYLYDGNDYICDPVYGLFSNWNQYYQDVFRYFWNQNCVAFEPPDLPPGHWDWPY